ncbi:MAG: MraY family glycosyltransferase [Pyrinomonadaceae bacterium]
MNTYLLLFIVATCSSLIITPLVRRLSEHFGWLDVPEDDRRVHQRAVPRLGGIAIFASVAIALAMLGLLDNRVTQALDSSSTQLFAVLVPATLVFLFGVYDDLFGASSRLKFIVQGLAGALLFTMGGRIEALSLPLFGSVELPLVLSFVLTVIWTVGITNAFNLIDGMDGLATGAALFAALVMLTLSLIMGNHVDFGFGANSDGSAHRLSAL